MRLILTTLILGICLFGLSGCTITQAPDPGEVMSSLTASLAELTSVHYDADLRLTGQLASQIVDGLTEANFDLVGDITDLATLQPKLSLSANIDARASSGPVSLSGNLVGADNSTYFQLTQFSIPSLLPVQLTADQQWYKFDNRNTGLTSTSKPIEPLSQLTEDEMTLISQLISGSRIFEVIESFPQTTVGSERAHHYRVKIDPVELTNLLDGIAEVTGTPNSLPSLDYLADYTPDIFVSTRTNQLLRIKLTDIYMRADLPVAFDLQLDLSRHNSVPGIVPPQSSHPLPAEGLFSLPGFGGF